MIDVEDAIRTSSFSIYQAPERLAQSLAVFVYLYHVDDENFDRFLEENLQDIILNTFATNIYKVPEGLKIDSEIFVGENILRKESPPDLNLAVFCLALYGEDAFDFLPCRMAFNILIDLLNEEPTFKEALNSGQWYV